MVLSESVIATLITGGVGIAAIFANKFKLIVSCGSCCRLESCKFGFVDTAIVDEHTVEFKKINVNGNDLIYVSKNVVNIDDEDDNHTIPQPDFIPENERQRQHLEVRVVI